MSSNTSSTKHAMVTGGASGIGLATAERLRAEGLTVTTLDVSPGADLQVDVTDPARLQATVVTLPPVDVLVNSAGVLGPRTPLWEVTDAQWLGTFAVNVHGTFNACRAVVPGMVQRGWGRIVNVGAVAGKVGNPGSSAYSASKGAVIALTKSLGKELATTGVLVNAVAPATIETRMHAGTSPESMAEIRSQIPMNRVGRADEVAELIAWLCSEKVTFSTGAVFDVSGGRAPY